jgi:RNA polymerase-interacting CarD/CdnL/TRCF family regulator
MMAILHMLQSRQRSRCSTGLMTADQVRRVLSAAPCALPSDPDERSRLVARKLQTGDPSRLAEIVRDLTWHQRKGLAHARDLQLLRRATLVLSAWLAAYKGIGQARARKRIRGTVERTVSLFTGQ